MSDESAGNAPSKNIRFGIMCRGPEVAAWEAACVRHLLAIDGVEVGLIIVDDSEPPAKLALGKRLQQLFNPNTIVWRLYQRLMLNPRSLSTQAADLSNELTGVEQLRCVPIQSGRFVQRFRAEDVDAIRAKDLDFILRFAFNILKGDILEAARFGVWSFHHGDPERYRGLPPGFWEIYERNPVTGTVLQRLTERLDAGVMLHKGFFKTNAASYARSRDTIFFGAADWPASLCRVIQAGAGHTLTTQASTTAAPIYRAPNSLQMIRFVLVSMTAWVSQQWRSLFLTQQWSVGIIDAPVGKVAGLHGDAEQRRLIQSARWLPEPKGRFLADPFAVLEGNGIRIFAEDYDWLTELGHISTLVVDERGEASPIEPVIRLSTHLSYPFLLNLDGRLVCLPESSQSGQVTSFEKDQDKRDWQQGRTILDGSPVIDPTIFRHSGRWWMLGGQAGAMDNTKLYAWHADTLEGPWSPHLANPIKTDVRSSRPAGAPFNDHDGHLLRPSQDCSTGYGAAISLNRIKVLTADRFEEETIAHIRPDPRGYYPTGLHTLSGAGERTVIDGSRNAFLPRVSWRLLKRKLDRAL